MDMAQAKRWLELSMDMARAKRWLELNIDMARAKFFSFSPTSLLSPKLDGIECFSSKTYKIRKKHKTSYYNETKRLTYVN
jgi:hypothetical protein